MISVIICTFNRSDRLRHTLKSLQEMSVPANLSWELVVVDNNCIDDTRQVIENFSVISRFNIRYIFEGSQGLSHARNLGIKEARGEILAFTDDDVTVDPNWLGHLKAAFDAEDCIGVAGKIVPVWTCGKPAWLDTNGPHRFMKAIPSFDLGDDRCEIKTPPFGANMAFRKAAFEKYGLFRIDLGRTGTNLGIGEDTEFGRRLIHAKERLLYAPNAVVYHPVEPERAKKNYYQSWYFNYGRTAAKLNRLSHGAGFQFKQPAWIIRNLLTGLLKWTFAFDSDRRFHHKLRICKTLGQLAEFFNIVRK